MPPARRVAAAMPNSDGRSIAEIITDLGSELMRELGIPGELTPAILSFAIDVGREDALWYDEQMLRDVFTSPEVAAFCRPTAARLFGMFRTDSIEQAFEYTAPESLPHSERREEVFVSTVKLARDVRKAVIDRSRAVYKVKYANHEFVITVRNQRPELFQSFQFHHAVGAGIEYAKSFCEGEIELCIATMAAGGDAAHDAQTAAFGYGLSSELADVFAYQKASLASDDVIAERFRERMRATLTYYKEIASQLG